jgi:hypothetical protein
LRAFLGTVWGAQGRANDYRGAQIASPPQSCLLHRRAKYKDEFEDGNPPKFTLLKNMVAWEPA